jgi:hypothetical protein
MVIENKYVLPGLLLVLAALQLEEGGVLVLVALAALVARENGLGVQSTGLRSHSSLK